MPTVDPELQTAPEPWLRDATEVARALGTDLQGGLEPAEVSNRLAHYGPNELESGRPAPAWRKFLRQFQDALIYLLGAAITISLVAWLVDGAEGFPVEVVVIAAIVLANGVIGYLQEARAEHAVAALRGMAAPMASVIRSGAPQTIPASGVVPGDLLVLEEGDAVPADARLFQAASLRVAEAPLTGESEPVLKDPATLEGTVALGDRFNMVFAGTAVASGRGRAVVTTTAMGTEMGGIARLLEQTTDDPTPLQREVSLIGRFLAVSVTSIAVIVVVAILLTSQLEDAGDLVDVLLVGVSLAVAAVPEGLPAVLSVVLALGVQRMARQRAIVKRLASVESLGSASAICSDKTGTLTRNEMTVTTVITASGVVTLTGTGYRPEGEAIVQGRPLGDSEGDASLRDEMLAVVGGGGLANDAILEESSGHWSVRGDPTDGAFLVAELKLGATEARRARFDRVAEAPFTSERKLMSTLHADAGREGRLVIVTKGAPDVLLSRCTGERLGGGAVRPLDDDRRAELLGTVDWLADQALRPLAVAYRELPAEDAARSTTEPEAFEHTLTFLGIAGIYDPPRPEAAAAIAEAQSAGIRVLMITGDHPRTALRIAGELGLSATGGRALTGVEIAALDDDALRLAVREVSVYARVAPQHKLRIVDALQVEGDIVAMTGDGVNDAPALRAADIGVAMGIAGTDVTRESADMILADDNFATIVAAVREGRAIFDNIRTFLRFLLSSNVGEVFTMFLGVMAAGLLGLDDTGEAIAVPLLATQILWINLLTDTAPALALGLDAPAGDVMRRPPRRRTDRVIDAEMQRGIAFVGIVMAIATLLALDLRLPGGLVGDTGSIDEARTMAFTTLVLAQLFNCFNARSDRTSAFERMFTNRLLWLAIAASLVLQVAVVQVPLLQDAFSTTSLSPADWLLCGGLASSVLWADEGRKLLLRRFVQSAS